MQHIWGSLELVTKALGDKGLSNTHSPDSLFSIQPGGHKHSLSQLHQYIHF